MGFLGGSAGRIHLRCRRTWFDSWVGKIPQRRDRPPSPVFLGFPGGSAGKESACNVGDLGSIPGLGRFPGEGNSYPLQYSCLENPHEQRSLTERVRQDRVMKHSTDIYIYIWAKGSWCVIFVICQLVFKNLMEIRLWCLYWSLTFIPNLLTWEIF